MDKRVFIVFTAILVLLGAIVGIKFLMKEPCLPPEITFTPERPVVGQIITFNANVDTEKKIIWNFGNGQQKEGGEVSYTYDTAGTQKVTASISDECREEKEIIVREKRTMKHVTPNVSFSNEIIHTGALIEFREISNEVTECNWKVLETNAQHSGQNFEYRFAKPGKYHLSVSIKGEYLNGDTTLEVIATKDKSGNEKAIAEAENNRIAADAKRRAEAEKNRLVAEAKREAEAEKRRMTAEIKRKADEEKNRLKAEAKRKADEEKNRLATEAKIKAERDKKPDPNMDAKFKSDLSEIGNLLADGNSDASDRWKDEIAPKVCGDNFSVKITTDGKPYLISSDQLKRKLINGDIHITTVIDIGRDKQSKCVNSVSIIAVEKK